MRTIGRYKSVVRKDQYPMSVILLLMLEAAAPVPVRGIYIEFQ